MDIFIWILLFILGCALGSGVTALILRNREWQENEHVKKGYAAEIEKLNVQLAEVKTKLQGARDEGKGYWDELQEVTKSCREAEESIKVIPGLEEKLQSKLQDVALLSTKNSDLLEIQDKLEKEIEEERKSFEESLIFVQGSHYLPANVVRNMMRQQQDTE